MPTTRTRTWDNRTNVQAIHDIRYSYAPYAAQYLFDAGFTGSIVTVSDVPHHRFELARRNGATIMDDCNISRVARSVVDGSITYDFPDYGIHMHGPLADRLSYKVVPATLPSFGGDDLQNLLVQAYAKMNKSDLLVG